jgi:hypothetical protein
MTIVLWYAVWSDSLHKFQTSQLILIISISLEDSFSIITAIKTKFWAGNLIRRNSFREFVYGKVVINLVLQKLGEKVVTESHLAWCGSQRWDFKLKHMELVNIYKSCTDFLMECSRRSSCTERLDYGLEDWPSWFDSRVVQQEFFLFPTKT